MKETPDKDCGTQWYVLRDLKRPNAKLPAYQELQQMGFRVYTPLQWQVEIKDGKRVRRQVPVIRDLLFVHDTKENIDKVVNSIATLQFRYVRGSYLKPMIVPAYEMENFLKASLSSDNLKYYLPDEITPEMCGRKVQIVDDAMGQIEGKILKIKGARKKRLLVELPGFFAVGIQIKSDYIEIQ